MSRKKFTAPAIALAAVVAVGVAGSAYALDRRAQENNSVAVCADFENTFGLYDEAPVTIRGITVGAVEKIEPQGPHVRVGMRIDKRDLPETVRAVVVNSSILADRRVELVDTKNTGGPALGDRCIAMADTAVPVSVSDALASFSGLVDQITEPAADGTLPLETMLVSANREFDGLGPTINREFRSLAELMADPDNFMSQLGQLLDNSAELTEFVRSEWADITTTLKTLGPGLEGLQQTLLIVKILVEKLSLAVEPMDRLFNEHFPNLMEVLEAGVPVLTLVRTRTEDSKDLLAKVPGVIEMLTTMVDNDKGAFEVGYRTPTSSVTSTDPQQLCAVINAGAASPQCEVLSGTRVGIPLPQLVFASVGGQR